MRRWLVIGVVLIAAASAAAVWMRRPRVQPAVREPVINQAVKPMTDEAPYTTYTGRAPYLTVRFEYPSAWQLREERGERQAYRQVRFMGPRTGEQRYRPYMAVFAAPLKSAGGQHGGLEEMLRNYTEHLQLGAEVLQNDQMEVGGIPGREVVVAYTSSAWRFHGVKKPGEVPVKTRTVMAQRGETLYQVTYSADQQTYDRYAADFQQLLNSLQFQ